jgi:hypothetical protein
MIKKEDIKTLWEQELQEICDIAPKNNVEKFLNIVGIMLYEKYGSPVSDLYMLVNDIDVFAKIINRFSGMTIKFPDRDELRKELITAIAYCMKTEKGMSWESIKKEIPFTQDKELLQVGRKLSYLDTMIKKELKTLMEEEI